MAIFANRLHLPYNIIVTTKTILLPLLALLLPALLFINGCNYPQAGCYSLVGLNHTGEQMVRIPFLVEEITDDSHMTTGFMVLLPSKQALLEVPLLNDEDTSSRSWNFGIATDDTQVGSIDISLTHFNGMLRFQGEYQANPTLEPWPVAGTVESDARSAWLNFVGELPYPHESLSDVFSFELLETNATEIEVVLQCSIEDALRVLQTTVSLDVAEPISDAHPEPPQRDLPPPKPPTRGVGRGR